MPPVISVITITGIGDHLQPEWLITFTGMRILSHYVIRDRSQPPNQISLRNASMGWNIPSKIPGNLGNIGDHNGAVRWSELHHVHARRELGGGRCRHRRR